jgi:sugar phosphate isomerase/epimerase
MKLAFSTLPCSSWSLAQVVAICTANQIAAIEIRLGLNDWSAPDLDDAALARVAATLKAAGIAVSNLGTGLVIRADAPEKLDELRACIRYAAAVGAPGLRIMLGTYKLRHSEAAPEADLPGIVRWLRQACALAAESGVGIWIETHNEFASIASLRRLLDAVQAPNLKILWDVIHTLEVGESVAQSLVAAQGDLVHVHIKDGLPWPDPDLANWRYTRLGEGDIPLGSIVGALQSRGYGGHFSLEWEPAWRPEIRGPGFEAEAVIPHFARFMRRLDTQAGQMQ